MSAHAETIVFEAIEKFSDTVVFSFIFIGAPTALILDRAGNKILDRQGNEINVRI